MQKEQGLNPKTNMAGQKPVNESKVWTICLLQALATVFLYALNIIYYNKDILILFSVFTFLSALSYLYYYFTRHYKSWSVIAILLVCFDFGFYVFNGGNQGAGILWLLVLPFLAIYLMGYKQGTLISIVNLLVLMFLVGLAFLSKVNMPYTPTFMIVFFIVNATILFLLYKIDKDRSRIQEDFDRIENLFTHATDLLFIGSTNGHFLTVNPACINVMGWSVEEWYGKHFMEFVHPADSKMTQDEFEQLIEKRGKSFIKMENRFQCKDGSYKWLSWRAEFDANKKLVYAIARDITAKKQQEQLYQDQSLLQSIIVDVSSDFLHSTPENVDAIIKALLQRVALFIGYERAYLIRIDREASTTTNYYEWNNETGIHAGAGTSAWFDVSEHTTLASYLNERDLLYIGNTEAFNEQASWLKEKCRRRGIASLFLLSLADNDRNMVMLGFDTTVQAKELPGQIVALLKVLGHLMYDVLLKNDVDVSLKESAEKLDDLNKTKDKLFSIIAHDLRSPLSTIIGFSELMTDDSIEYTVDTMREYAKLMNQVAMNTFDLLENLLDWSRLQRGLLKPEPSEVSVFDVIQSAIGPYEHKAQTRGLQVIIRVEDGLKVEVDKRMLETIIRNLYTNALKFTPPGGTVTIEAGKSADDCMLLCVSDSGIGIPESLSSILFTANEEKNRQGLGGERSSGIGLMLCKEFIEMLNGTISVQTIENKGSTFCINLPFGVSATTTL